MNRYNHNAAKGGPSKATTSTLCQKCLKRDNYECKASAAERPYVSRPSRTQQLADPKLVPSLASDVSQGLMRTKGVADKQLAQVEMERSRKRERESSDLDKNRAKRRRSVSSESVSTISTDLSRSPSAAPRDARRTPEHHDYRQLNPPDQWNSRQVSHHAHGQMDSEGNSERKRKRDPSSSSSSYRSDDESSFRRSRRRERSRSIRRRLNRKSPSRRGRRTSSFSTEGGDPNATHERRKSKEDRRTQDRRRRNENDEAADMSAPSEQPRGRRGRSLSPFSKRLALTEALGAGR